MIKHLLTVALFLFTSSLYAQSKLSIENVYSAYLRNSGTIMENNQIKGYFFLYQSDKIDKRTNEYTLQIVDENLNKVKDIKFQDSKKISLLEAAYNGNSLSFLFKNEENKTLDMKVYGIDGKLKYTYSREYTKKTEDLMKRYETMHTDEGTNQNVFDLGEKGYASVLPLRDGKTRTYEVDYYSSQSKSYWKYVPTDDEERYAQAEFLGATDSLIILEVMKRNRALSGKVTSHMVGIDITTKKKIFDLDGENDEFVLVPSNVIPLKGTGKILVMGSYFDKGDNVAKDASKGLAIYEIDGKGNVLSKTYNSWGSDFAKYLPTGSKGKLDKVGYLYIHKLIRTANGKIFAVGEGYKRQVSAGGVALTMLVAAGGSYGRTSTTKIVTTDMVIMEFNDKFKVTGATIYDKTNNTAELMLSDFNSQHAIAILLKMTGGFDYEFTTSDADNSTFTICYSDWVRSSDYKGLTFNTLRYNGAKFTKDKIDLKSKASKMTVLPAKAGSVMILEYFKKDKKLESRLEKIG
ncbi:DUF6770 family protein [uncultured Chitinophaga sp.]|jgi:hypothetical protein|uniref:DUF6770 family protein n=1 Tax=uncultured Chitinophaga sp. TaxID=339340 RepID=UPI0026386972|nr:DUF6770 family protein [uncultured Chitinophaga sp.]